MVGWLRRCGREWWRSCGEDGGGSGGGGEDGGGSGGGGLIPAGYNLGSC